MADDRWPNTIDFVNSLYEDIHILISIILLLPFIEAK
jgi:hypothetical protein